MMEKYISLAVRALIVNWTPRAEAWAYDPSTDSWTEIASMPEPRLAARRSLWETIFMCSVEQADRMLYSL